jgi:hypothetical protein
MKERANAHGEKRGGHNAKQQIYHRALNFSGGDGPS